MVRLSITKKRWITLGYGCFVLLIVGFIYAWSIFSVPFSEEFGWEPSTLSLTFTFLMWCFSLGGVIGTWVTRKITLRGTLIVAAAFIFFGFFGALFVGESTPWILYVTYGIFGGFGAGFTYTNVVGAVTPWFPDRPGFASGTLLMCYMLSTIVIGSAASAMFASIGWRLAFKIFGIVVAAVLVFGAIAIKVPNSAQLIELNTFALAKKDKEAAKKEAKEQRSFTPLAMLKKPITYIFWIWQFLLITCSLGTTSFVVQTAVQSGTTQVIGVVFLSIYSLSCGFGRPLVGTIFDKTSTPMAMVIVGILEAVGAAFLALGINLGSIIFLSLGTVIFAIGGGGVPVIVTSFAARCFGPKFYATNFSILNLMLIPAAYVGPAITSAALMHTGTLALGYWIFAIMSAVAIFFGAIIKGFEKRHLDRVAAEDAAAEAALAAAQAAPAAIAEAVAEAAEQAEAVVVEAAEEATEA